MKDRVVAIAVADVHLSLRPPLARAEEPDWLAAMERPWTEVKGLAEEHGAVVLCAGDLFDRWDAPAELITWAIRTLPFLYSIPGNHDLPGHDPDLVRRGGFGVLVAAGRIFPLHKKPALLVHEKELVLYGARLGGGLPQRIEKTAGELHVGLVHEFVWIGRQELSWAPEEHRLKKRARGYEPYDVVVCGDNHGGFQCRLKSGTIVVNCGTLLRRKSNEARYQPKCWLVRASGEVEPHKLDVSKDVVTELVHGGEEDELEARMKELTYDLVGMVSDELDFRDALRRVLEKRGTRAEVRKLVEGALELGAKR